MISGVVTVVVHVVDVVLVMATAPSNELVLMHNNGIDITPAEKKGR